MNMKNKHKPQIIICTPYQVKTSQAGLSVVSYRHLLVFLVHLA